MHDEMTITALRPRLSETMDLVRFGSTRLMILRNGRAVGALVSPEDLRALEHAEASRMAFHRNMHNAQLREIQWLKEGLDSQGHRRE